MSRIELKQSYTLPSTSLLVDVVAEQTQLSKSVVKRALTFGGGWVKSVGEKSLKRCRKAKQLLKPGDYFEFYYDADLLATLPQQPEPILQTDHWGIWYKPANQVSQGSRYGDLNSLEVCVQRLLNKPVYLVHRLDREARGLLMLAYSSQAAAALSKIWSTETLSKRYQARIHGTPPEHHGHIRVELDGKVAHTEYTLASVRDDGTSLVDIRLHSGRLHQIRRHFAALGHPLTDDPKYGGRPTSDKGLQLVAVELGFNDPCKLGAPTVRCRLPDRYCLF